MIRRLVSSIKNLLASPTGRRFALFSASKAVAALLQIVAFGALARLLGVADFGLFSIAYSVTVVAMSFFEFGLGNRALRLPSDSEPHRTIGTILTTRTATNALVIVLFTTLWPLFTQMSVVSSLCIVIFITGDLFANLLQSILIGIWKERLSVVLLLARRVFNAAGLALLLLLDEKTVEPIAYGVLGITGLLGYVLGAGLVVRSAGRPHNPFHFIRTNLHFMTTSLASNIQQADSLVVGSLGGPYFAGLFGSASRLSAPLNLVTGSIMQSIVPSLAAIDSLPRRAATMKRVMRAATALGVVIVILAVTAPVVVLVLYGQAFADAWPIAAAVIVLAGINAINQPIFAWYYAGTIPRILPVVIASTSLTNLSVLALLAGTGNPFALSAGMVLVGLAGHIWLRLKFTADLRRASEDGQ